MAPFSIFGTLKYIISRQYKDNEILCQIGYIPAVKSCLIAILPCYSDACG